MRWMIFTVFLSEPSGANLLMWLRRRKGTLTILAQSLILFACITSFAQQSEIVISSPEDIKAEFTSVPCKDSERLNAAKALFIKVGAPASDISIDKHEQVENLIIRKQGASKEIVVIGAHYDKVARGCGAIDNWTGVVALAHLYRSLKDFRLNRTLLFVAFGKEEAGLVGSHALVSNISGAELDKYCLMINIDSLGLGAPGLLDNLSSQKLAVFTAALAKEMQVPFARGNMQGVNADSSSFRARKIPAMTIHGLSDAWPTILHGPFDQASKINSDRVYLVYRLVLALVVRLDGTTCAEFKE